MIKIKCYLLITSLILLLAFVFLLGRETVQTNVILSSNVSLAFVSQSDNQPTIVTKSFNGWRSPLSNTKAIIIIPDIMLNPDKIHSFTLDDSIGFNIYGDELFNEIYQKH